MTPRRTRTLSQNRGAASIWTIGNSSSRPREQEHALLVAAFTLSTEPRGELLSLTLSFSFYPIFSSFSTLPQSFQPLSHSAEVTKRKRPTAVHVICYSVFFATVHCWRGFRAGFAGRTGDFIGWRQCLSNDLSSVIRQSPETGRGFVLIETSGVGAVHLVTLG